LEGCVLLGYVGRHDGLYDGLVDALDVVHLRIRRNCGWGYDLGGFLDASKPT